MLLAIPLLIIPFALYNLAMTGLFGDGGTAVLDSEVMAINMLSGTTWTMAFGDLLILIALVLLFVVFLVEFLLVQGAATQIFFILMTITFIDVIAGFAVSIRTASRDLSIGL